MHAFDLDKVSGGAVIVRRAAKGEKIVVIDGTERLLDDSVLVIADSSGPVAVAGVMGGIRTEVGLSTRNILLEAAYFDPICTRRASRKLALSSESSYRFERKVDMDNIKYSSDRATELILKAAGGDVCDYIDIGKKDEKPIQVSLDPDRVNNILGASVAPSKVINILTSLGLKLKTKAKNNLKFEIPNFRQDLKDEIDLVEEVARIYGYDNIPETLPQVVEKAQRMPIEIITDNKIRETLKGLGLSEIITYSLISKKILSMCGSGKDPVSVKNPLSAEQEVMRPSSIPGLLGVMRYNINRKMADLELFELGKTYFRPAGSSFKERRNLTVGITGEIHDGWVGKSRAATLFDLKGILERLFSLLGVGKFSLRSAEDNIFSSGVCASIEVKGEPIGLIGEVEQRVLKNFDIKEKVYALEIDCEALLKFISLKKYFKEPARYPSVARDISLVVDNKISNDDIISLTTKSAGALLKRIDLIDMYRGGQIPEGKISLTYHLEYQDATRTLEESQVTEAHSRVTSALQNDLGATLRQ